jgi:hypothetical protein
LDGKIPKLIGFSFWNFARQQESDNGRFEFGGRVGWVPASLIALCLLEAAFQRFEPFLFVPITWPAPFPLLPEDL